MTFEKYGPLKEIADGLYCRDGEWEETPFRRRMTVVRTNSGLIVHNAFRLEANDLAELKSLGPIVAIIAPNLFHDSEAGWLVRECPGAKLYVPMKLAKKFMPQFPQTHILEKQWNDEPFAFELQHLALEGTRVGESVFYHKLSRTLIVTDLVFNLQGDVPGMMGAFLKWNQIYKTFGPSRLFRWVFTSDRKALQRSLNELDEWDYDRIVMNHGEILESGGKRRMKEVFSL